MDLPAESAVAALGTITLPETFGDFDITLPEGELEYVQLRSEKSKFNVLYFKFTQ